MEKQAQQFTRIPGLLGSLINSDAERRLGAMDAMREVFEIYYGKN
jgi:hypothetical protein